MRFFTSFHQFLASSWRLCARRCFAAAYRRFVATLLNPAAGNSIPLAPRFLFPYHAAGSLATRANDHAAISRWPGIPKRRTNKAWKRGESINMSRDIVYALVKKIPRGKVLTYGALAKATHLPGGARAVGRAMAATPRGQAIPWHRVVGAGGKLLIREPYAALQKKLLVTEGARIIESRVDLKTCAWIPAARRSAKQKPPAKRRTSGAAHPRA
jgi:methylated-DNA-protein-cysteine methyltransferase related protein